MRARRRARRRSRRSKAAGLLAPLLGVLATPWVQKALGVALVYVVVLNTFVRYVGHGDAFVLSVFRIPEKSYAVGMLALHSVRHLWSTHDEAETRAIVMQAATDNGVPAGLALAIARTESGMHPHCISSTGAMGLMQLMPWTALAHGVIDPYDPEDNARGATRFLHELSQRYHGDSARMAAAYNAGAGRVPRSGELSGLPPETRVYVERVVRRHQER